MPKNTNDVITGIVVDETITFTLTEISEHYAIDLELLDEMVEHGLFTPAQIQDSMEPCVDVESLKRIQTALHLYQELGVNIPGTALVLDLLEEMEMLRNKLSILERNIQNDHF